MSHPAKAVGGQPEHTPMLMVEGEASQHLDNGYHRHEEVAQRLQRIVAAVLFVRLPQEEEIERALRHVADGSPTHEVAPVGIEVGVEGPVKPRNQPDSENIPGNEMGKE